jgi:type I restriction enzyme S subunit
MASTEELITQNIGVWTAAIKRKSSAGRGNGKNLELYGVKKLRELILDLAVRGLLVPQNPIDMSASLLLEKIAAEKAELLKNGKPKKNIKKSNSANKDSLPPLPQGWAHIGFGELYELEYGNNLPKTKRSESGEFPVYGSNGIVGSHNEKSVSHPCIVIGRKGSAGALNLCEHAGCWVTDVAYSIVPSKHLSLRFAFLAMHTYGLESLGKGIKPGLSRNEAYSLILAIPPLAEQHRIVAKVDELMAFCDQLEQQTEASITAHQTLVETLLGALTQNTSTTSSSETESNNDQNTFEQAWQRITEHFDTLFTTEHSIELLEQTILQLAVMGKLVPQDHREEPAAQLYKKMSSARDKYLEKASDENREASTMIRKLNKLNKPNHPFKLPSNWTCVHLIQLSIMLVDCHYKTAPYKTYGIPIIRTTNIKNRCFTDKDLKFVDQETYEFWSRRCPPTPGDIFFTREAPMGEALIVPENTKWCLGQRTMLIRPNQKFISNQYLLLALTEPHLLERASEHAIGSTVKHLRVGDVENLAIPLPPLDEQNRIVEKFNELSTICDRLKKSLADSKKIQLQLADVFTEKAVD